TAPLSATAGRPAAAGPWALAWAPPVFTLARVVTPVESGSAPAAGGATGPTGESSADTEATNTQRRSQPRGTGGVPRKESIRPPSVSNGPPYRPLSGFGGSRGG